MINEEPTQLICIRPHHISTFVQYHINGKLIQEHEAERYGYGAGFVKEMRNLFSKLISKDDICVLITDGSHGDSICGLCKKDQCTTHNNPDDLNIWNGSGMIMQTTRFQIGRVYSSKEFLERVRGLYPFKTPGDIKLS